MKFIKIGSLFIIVAFIFACSSGSSSSSSSGGGSTTDITGTWKGTAASTGTANYVNITFTITQSGNSISGTYACSPGTDLCLTSSMTLSATISGTSFTGTGTTTGINCGFTGTANGSSLGGSYSCNSGVYTGTWDTAKQ